MKKLILVGAVTLACSSAARDARAQDVELTSDRPDFTESVVVVRRAQLESGYTWTRTSGASRHAIGELLLRMPLTPRFELRLAGSSYAITRVDGGSTGGAGGVSAQTSSGFEDAGIGVKLSLGAAAALIVSAGLPTGSDTETTDGVAPEALLSLERALTERVALGINVAAASQPGELGRSAEAGGSAALSFSAGAATGLFAEVYGTRVLNGPSAERDHSIFADVGATRLVTPDLQLDARIGRRLNGASEWFLGVGLVRRW
jgi:hypothetical protein